MVKNYVLDTNVMVHDPNCFYSFEDNNVIIPIVCIEELDNLKKREGVVGYQARSAARELSRLRRKGSLRKGIRTEGGGTVRVDMSRIDSSDMPQGFESNKNDSKIIAMAKKLADDDLKRDLKTILVSKDMYMQIKGDAIGLEVQDYKTDRVELEQLYSGYAEVQLSSEQIVKIHGGGIDLPESLMWLEPNQFAVVKSDKNEGHEIVARRKGDRLVPLQYTDVASWGLKPINREQAMAYELLMDPEVSFVSVSGGAGSGKTIVATAVALQKVIEEGSYRKIVFVRPVVAAGDNIGYLPGDENEKLRPWMGSFYDAIENLIDVKSGKRQVSNKHTVYNSKPDFAVDEFIDQQRRYGVIETKTFTYMRGRTFTDALVIVDEAQEITPHLAKLMLTRAGYGSKFVFLGDPSDNQIDNTLVDSKSNGLVYVIEKLKHSELTGHVSLKKVVRSPLAEVAERDL